MAIPLTPCLPGKESDAPNTFESEAWPEGPLGTGTAGSGVRRVGSGGGRREYGAFRDNVELEDVLEAGDLPDAESGRTDRGE